MNAFLRLAFPGVALAACRTQPAATDKAVTSDTSEVDTAAGDTADPDSGGDTAGDDTAGGDSGEAPSYDPTTELVGAAPAAWFTEGPVPELTATAPAVTFVAPVASDITHDAETDLVFWSREVDVEEGYRRGALFAFEGPFEGQVDLDSPSATLRTDAETSRHGAPRELSNGADVDGDGIADLIVGDTIFDSRGAALLFFGPLTGDRSYADADNIVPHRGIQYFGGGPDIVDLTGDGVADLLVSGDVNNSGSTDGIKFLVPGPLDDPALDPADYLELTGDNCDGAPCIGRDAAIGDLDGDGALDVLLAQEQYNPGDGSCFGAIFAVLGPVTTSREVADADHSWRDCTGAYYLIAPHLPGDLDGDGHADVAADVVLLDSTGAGCVRVGLGPFGEGDNEWTLDVSCDGSAYASWPSSAAIGDIDGDGRDDLAIGDQYADPSRLSIFTGPWEGTLTHADAALTIESSGDLLRLGSTTISGDFDQDGRGDILTSSAYQDHDRQEHSFLFLAADLFP